MAMFPARVNIVFGQRWVLAKKKHGNCPAEIVHVSEVQKQQRFRKKGDYRWLIQEDSRLDGFLIRNDHHPRRALVGGIPLRLEGANKTNANQRWLLCFPNDSPGLHKPFLIRSVQSDMYLVVEEAYQCVILQKDAPEQFWRMHDATRRAESFIPSEPTPQPTSPFATEDEAELLVPYDGDAAGAFCDERSSRTSKNSQSSLHGSSSGAGSIGGVDFTPVEILFREMVLNDSYKLLPDGAGLPPGQILAHLWGNSSTFLYRYQARRNGRDVRWSGLDISDETPWLATAELSCSVHVPMLGWRSYQEVVRIALCYEPMAFSGKLTDGDVSEVLVVQQVGHTDGGRFGIFRSESVLLFYQPEIPGPTMLRAFALTPKGAFAGMAIEGQKKAHADFLHVFHEEAKTWSRNGKAKPKAVAAAVLSAGKAAKEFDICCAAAARTLYRCGVQ